MATEEAKQAAPSGPSIIKCPKCITKRSAIIKLLTQPMDSRIIYPREYLAASHEVFGLTLLITWILTLVYFPEQVFEHPARPIIGSFNPCFGWDYPPASYIALTFCSFNVLFTWRYAWLEYTRTALLNRRFTTVEKFSTLASFLLAVSSNVWLLLWLLGPTADQPRDPDGPVVVNWFIHTGIFITYATSSYLAALGNYLEVATGPNKDVVRAENRIFIIVYGIVGTYLGVVYFYDLIMFEYGEEPALHPILTQTADFLWMGCIISVDNFLPPEPPLEYAVKVLPLDAGPALE